MSRAIYGHQTLAISSIGIGSTGSTRHCGIGPGGAGEVQAWLLDTAGADAEEDGAPALGSEKWVGVMGSKLTPFCGKRSLV
jgi:hypothetical protein